MVSKRISPIALLITGLLGVVLQTPVSAGQIDALDGSLSDWGVTLNGDGSLNFGTLGYSTIGTTRVGSGSATIGGFHFHYDIEDQIDSSTGYLGPHYGGQKYDAEFLGVGIDDGDLVIAISTGQRFEHAVREYAPGDIMIQTTSGVYGVEVGGSTLSGGSVTKGLAGTFYELYSSGYTKAVHHTSDKTAGSIWEGAVWSGSTVDGELTQFQLSGGGISHGMAIDYLYSFPAGKHAFIEVRIPTSVFGVTTIDSVRWAPSCNNDYLETTNLNMSTPEPGSLSLVLIGGLGIGGYVRRRRKAFKSK